MGGEVEIDWRIREAVTLEGKVRTVGFLSTPSGGPTPTLGDPAQNDRPVRNLARLSARGR